MYSVFKYNFILYLQKTYKNKFSLSLNKKIIVLPPILKKIGLKIYVCFFVINKNFNNDVNRPIGLICVSRNKKIKIYDFNEYDFCTENNFYKTYYNFSNKNFCLNTPENEELLRIYLQNLYNIYSKLNIFKDFYNSDYKNYLSKIKNFFPEKFFNFYKLLQNNNIKQIGIQDNEERKIYYNQYLKEEKELAQKKEKLEEDNKQNFYNYINNNLKIFIREEVMPSFKSYGSFSKLSFYNEIGNFLKNNKLDEHYNCFNPELNNKELTQNKLEVLNKLKVSVIKIYSKTIDQKYYKNNNIDTLSKVLIVFLNCLLIEEINKSFSSNFEEEIKECKEIFNENINHITIEKVKETLQEYYKDLCNDYLESCSKNFSNIYYAYLFIFRHI